MGAEGIIIITIRSTPLLFTNGVLLYLFCLASLS